MFSKLSLLALVLPLVNALTINTPSNLSSGGPATITWTNAAGDPPTFSLELVNVDNFHNSFGIANNVNPSTQTISLTLPIVPAGPGYTLQAVNITDINQVYAQSGSFSIAPTVSSSSSSSASSTSSGASSSSSVSGSVTPTPSSSSSTPFGSTLSSSSGASSTPSSGSSSSSSPAPSPSNFNGNGNGASSMGFGSWLALAAAAIAGGAVAV